MISKLRLVFTITIGFFSFYGTAQDNYWSQETSQNKISSNFSRQFDVQRGLVFNFDEAEFKKKLTSQAFAKEQSKQVYFPDQTGKMIAFRVHEASVLSPELARKYPNIKSYVGYASDGSNDKIRFSISHKGIQSMLVSAKGDGNTFLQKDGNGRYIVYTRSGYAKNASNFICSTSLESGKASQSSSSAKPVTGQVVRKFRLAVSATGEYTQFHGGTVADALAAINATVTRINEVFETDLGVQLELIAGMEAVIFTDPENDPYVSSPSNTVQTTLTTTIGEGNYDLGILFGKTVISDGNAGSIGNVCVDGAKGSAFALGANPVGDVFDLDLVAHEIGHQFGANHTWSYRNESGNNVQVEPGSGTTIMAYAGIAGEDDVAPQGEDYFHYVSIDQIADYLETINCAEIIPLTNLPPVVTPTGGFTIPKSTAFVLTGNATDPDSGDVLTYAWEQVDDGIVKRTVFGPMNVNGANFRSQRPSTDPSRYFPSLSRVMQGALTQTNPGINTAWETVSDVARELNFALTVRDNAMGGGQVTEDLVSVLVEDTAGPFVLTSQASGGSVTAGAIEVVTWDVANTDSAPINANTVDILLSVDGGDTFPITLADGVPNDGNHPVIIPGTPSSEARIMVKASENIFFAVNTASFVIAPTEIVFSFSALNYEVCQGDVLVVPFTYETYLGFAEEVTFSVTSPPAGLDIAFNPAVATATNTAVDITFSNTENVIAASYPISVTATSATTSHSLILNVDVFNSTFTEVVLVSPANAETQVSKNALLEWSEEPIANSYDVEIATDALFADIIASVNVTTNSYIPKNIENGMDYFWRVKSKNSCDESAFSTSFGFTTIEANCVTKSTSDLPTILSTVGTPTITSAINFFEDLPLTDVNVNLELEHSYVGDLTVTLTSPAGTVVTLFSGACESLNDVNATFDDDGATLTCSTSPAISGTVRPLEGLFAFNGESLFGEWVLTVVDKTPADGGVLTGFSLDVCAEGDFRPDEDKDGVYDDGPDLCLGTPEGATVDTSGCQIFLFANDAFTVELQSESCSSNNNGQLAIQASQTLDYTISIVGPGTNTTADFTTNYEETGLSEGIYMVCVGGTDGAITYEERCFEVVISEPDPLGVSAKVSVAARSIELDLEGGAIYNIELNGVLTQTTDSKISLLLQEGSNALKVSTDLSCQGAFEERIYISSEAVVYPNPFEDRIRVAFNSAVDKVVIGIFAADGRLVQKKEYRVAGVELELDLSHLPSGLYQLRMESANGNQTAKLLKR